MVHKSLKHFYHLTLSLILLAVPAGLSAEVIDGITYKLDDSSLTAEVTSSSSNYSGDITIPASVEYNGSTYAVTSIGQSAFQGCIDMTSIEIPASVTSINQNAFFNCTGLTSIELPSSLTTIGNYAFYICSGLTSLKIPASVTSIGRQAFESCTGLTSLEIPASVISIGLCAFSECSGLREVTIADSESAIELDRDIFYNTPITKVYLGRNYTYNNDYSPGVPFFNHSSITDLTIGISVTSIPDYAFQRCTSLTSITIPASVTSIGDYTFAECTGLTDVTLADGDSELQFGTDVFFSVPIEKLALGRNFSGTPFRSKTSLKNLSISNSVTFIGGFAFYGCSALTDLTIADGEKNLDFDADIFNGSPIENLYLGRNFSGTPFRSKTSLKNLTIGNSVTAISEYAFDECSGLTSLEIPASVTSIGEYAFSDCSGLTSLDIPSSVTTIGNAAFYHCSALTSVTIADGDSELTFGQAAFAGSPVNHLHVGRNFSGAPFPETELKDLTISNSVTTIGDHAFNSCQHISSIEIPTSVSTIGNLAFGNCSALTEVTIADGDSELQFGMFVFDSAPIENLYLGRNFSGAPFRSKTSLKNLTIGNSVTAISEYAFNECSGLTSLEIPASVTSIGEYAFSDCSGLTSLEIPSSVTSIGNAAFLRCSALTSVTIADGDSELTFGQTAFAGSPVNHLHVGRNFSGAPFPETELKDLTISNSVTTIGDHAFNSCQHISSIEIPASVSTIGNLAFGNCSALTEVTIADGDSELQFGTLVFDSAPIETLYLGRNFSETPFRGLTSLKNLTISNSVTSIGYRAFRDCSGLTSLELPASVTSIGISAFECCSGLTSVEIPASVASILDYAFYGCSGLTSLDIPASVTSIGIYTFSECSGLREVTIADSESAIELDRDIFYNTPIAKLYLGRNYTYINNYSTGIPFFNHSSITDLTIGQSVTTIPDYAFYGCSGLTSLEIPSSVTSIGQFAFYGCSATENVTISDSATTLACGTNAFSNVPVKTLYLGRNLNSNAFSHNSELSDLTISDSVTEICNSCFNKCTGLTSVDIPSSVTSIGQNAFKGCTGLTDFTIPASVTSIGESAFNDCSALTNVVIADGESTLQFNQAVFAFAPVQNVYLGRDFSGTPFASTPTLKELTIGSSVTILPASAFVGCTSIPSVEIPASVTSIERNAFSGCSALTDVTIADGESNLAFGENVFYDAPVKKLYLGRNFTYPDEMFSYGPFCFHESITDLTIGNSVTSIPDYAFYGCYGLTDVTLADGESELQFGDDVFADTPVETLYLGRNSSETPFRGVTSLKNLAISNSVTSLPANAFSGCSGLTEIGCEAMTPPTAETTTFDADTYTSATLSVPEEARAAYLAHPVWRKFTSIHIVVESITLDHESFKGHPGDSFQIKATVLPADATNPVILWSSSDDAIATVDQDGNVELLAVGNCEITATTTDGSDLKATCTVESEPILVESITLDPDNYKGQQGDSFQIKATVLPADATDKTIIWSSSNDAIATVDQEGNVTLILTGYCEITAKAADGSEVEATCEIDIATMADLINSDSLLDSPVTVYNTAGQLLFTTDVKETLTQLPAGIYIMVQNGSAKKIVIR